LRTLLQRLLSVPLISRRTVALGAILVAAAVLRLAAFNVHGFNSDEAVYAGQAAAIAQDPELSPLFPVFRAHPLFFQFILSIFFTVGTSDWIARLAGIVFGLSAVFLTYRLGKRLYCTRAGLF
jgi:4-amino-4-deoxy-L-arabinose transferase-like glycosyltransferase